ncbi:flagellar hook assembly protein FlgD [Falsiroseomonas sp. CW058]|uniref:flagellar hook assembly protein FlgD n=1 Tax=Falsiroseomonas sp. CW058 TaxID=3388664 RepID=UPI003D319685
MSATISSPTPAAPAAAAGAGPRLSADLGTFLTLLTTQLRNQDPTQPMDANQLTQQLVQFATVEQQLQGNRTLERLLTLQQAGQLAGAAALVGRRVTVEGDRLPLQSGAAEVGLPAAGRARTARIEVSDAAGAVLRTEDVTLAAGVSAWRWDGRDARGVQRPDGAYRVAVRGLGADGMDVPLSFTVAGLVTGAGREGGDLVLRMGGVTVGFDRLRELPGS